MRTDTWHSLSVDEKRPDPSINSFGAFRCQAKGLACKNQLSDALKIGAAAGMQSFSVVAHETVTSRIEPKAANPIPMQSFPNLGAWRSDLPVRSARHACSSTWSVFRPRSHQTVPRKPRPPACRGSRLLYPAVADTITHPHPAGAVTCRRRRTAPDNPSYIARVRCSGAGRCCGGRAAPVLAHREVVGSVVLLTMLFQCTGVDGPGERHVGDFFHRVEDQTTAFSRICGDALRVHRVPRHWLTRNHGSFRHFPVYRHSEHYIRWPARTRSVRSPGS